MQVHTKQLGPGFIQQVQTVCSECRGDGESIDPKHKCKQCDGHKIVQERKVLEVHVDKGKHILQNVVMCIRSKSPNLYHGIHHQIVIIL